MSCFNGAARFCVRKSSVEAEAVLGQVASMGPHVFACGNQLARNPPSLPEELQWGRTFLRAEIATTRSPAVAGRKASMGPHVFACGNSTRALLRQADSRGFNGAARFCVRKCGRGPEVHH